MIYFILLYALFGLVAARAFLNHKISRLGVLDNNNADRYMLAFLHVLGWPLLLLLGVYYGITNFVLWCWLKYLMFQINKEIKDNLF